MSDLLWLLAAFAAALVLALALSRVVIALGVVDAPTEARKKQKAPVPTSGGLGVAVAAIFAVIGVLQFTHWPAAPTIVGVAAGSLAALFLGLLDDRRALPPRLKLFLMIAIALGMAIYGIRPGELDPWPGQAWLLPAAIAIAGSMLWLILVVNAVNFMDGANGLSMGMAALAAAGLTGCAVVAGAWSIALMSAALFGGLCGFLVWNIGGRLFAGDAGALFIGAALGGLSLELVRVRPDWLFVPAILLLPFLTDVILTLIWRAGHRKPLFTAHLDHAYQIAMKAGLKHWQVSAVHAVWALNAVGLAIIAAIAGGWAPLLAFVVLLGVSCWINMWVRRSGERAGLVGADVQ